MASRLSVGQLITFLLATLIGGLAQLWCLYFVLLALDRPFKFGQLLGDGGLFFFATSLGVSSYLTLSGKRRVRPGSSDFNISFVAAFAIGVPAVTTYSSVLTANLGAVSPFESHVLPQICVAFASLSYSIYVGVRTGVLSIQET